jgi:N utilization substance protein B
MRLKRQSRILAMQALCQHEAAAVRTSDDLLNLWTLLEAPVEAVGYATSLVQQFQRNSDEIDQQIGTALEHWSLSRLSMVERNILRTAAVELRSTDIPPKVAIDEAVEVAREYGGADSPRFVNGVLDRMLRELRKDVG